MAVGDGLFECLLSIELRQILSMGGRVGVCMKRKIK
jgi:hypothetical protein